MTFLATFYANFFADPLYYIGIIFALWGAWGFGLFIAGFADGIGHVFTFGLSDSHVEHARLHVMHGLFITMTAFGAWEVVRVIAGVAPWQYLILSFFLLTPLWIPRLAGSGGGH
jgi:hypothetical protein